MNFCNFGKVIIARATKDLTTIKWWNEEQTSSQETQHKPVFTQNLCNRDRYDNYQAFMHEYTKMNIEFDTFNLKLHRVQEYLANKKYWVNKNKNKEQKKFIDYFSLQKWVELTVQEKKQHRIENCIPCTTIHVETSKLHKSIPGTSQAITDDCENLAGNMIGMISPNSSGTAQKGLKVIKSVVEVLQPIVENQLDVKFGTKLSSTLSITPNITPKDHQKEVQKSLSESRN